MLSCAALLGLTMLPLLGGCAGKTVTIDSDQHKALLEKDRADMARYEGQTISLSLDQALKRAIEKNLDARVAEMDMVAQSGDVTLKQLEATPQLKATRSLNMRSNDGASSSRSVQSGLQSLEPSQSTDRRRMTTSLEANWNLLDAGLAIAESARMEDESGIPLERYSKVIQNIERDVFAAYWRAYEFQRNRKSIETIIKGSEHHLVNLNRALNKKLMAADAAGDQAAELEDKMRLMHDLEANLASAEIELKALLSYPQSSILELKQPNSNNPQIENLIKGNIQDQEWAALKSRPELREEVYQKNSAVKKVRQELLKTLPGIEPLVSYNTDTNSFLQESQWTNFTLGITQNILNVLTLPMRYEAAKQKEVQADARRQALGAALIAQVHLSRQRLDQDINRCDSAKRSASIAQKRSNAKVQKAKAGFISGSEKLMAQTDAQIAGLRKSVSCAAMQDSYAAMINALGQHIYKGELPTERIKAQKAELKKQNFNKMGGVNG